MLEPPLPFRGEPRPDTVVAAAAAAAAERRSCVRRLTTTGSTAAVGEGAPALRPRRSGGGVVSSHDAISVSSPAGPAHRKVPEIERLQKPDDMSPDLSGHHTSRTWLCRRSCDFYTLYVCLVTRPPTYFAIHLSNQEAEVKQRNLGKQTVQGTCLKSLT